MAGGILGQLPAGEYPYFTEMIVDHALKPGYNYRDEFEIGLDLIREGLEWLSDRSMGGPPTGAS